MSKEINIYQGLFESQHSAVNAMYAEIIIPLALPKNYTWRIPEYLQASAQTGLRVEVELKNKKYSGIIKRIHADKPEAFEPKEILNILDSEPLVYKQQLKLWEWMAKYYMCSEGEIMQAAVPANLKLSSESLLLWNEEYILQQNDLNDDEYLVAEALEIKKELGINEVQQILDVAQVYPVVKKLIEKNVCFVWEELRNKYKPKTETYISLNPAYNNEERLADLLNGWSKAPKQMELLLSYLHLIKTEGEVSQTQLLKKSKANASQLKGLIDKNILIAQKRETGRLPSLPKKITIDFDLSAAQSEALNKIKQVFEEKTLCLLHGITASGKTEIYVKLIAEYINQGKQVLYMLPEIALTAQIIRRVQKHFGGNIVVYHSKFNANERVEIWSKVKSGEIKIVLGARSALFLPFRELGLLIVDEEHEGSYKQREPAPRYHARDTAVYYASLFNARVLLGSATPSVESYYNTVNEKYGLAELHERFGKSRMPEIEIIDLKQVAVKNNSKIILSPQLNSAIEKSLAEKKQVILFQNRRGYAPYTVCSICGWIPQCRNCDVTLTFHKSKNQLICHYCGTIYPVVFSCPACGSHQFMEKNFGTEKIEELLSEDFPSAQIARMDYDSIKGKNDHDTLIKLFEQQKIDMLVGTQMVVKGLDFEHVNLVAIPDADGLLNFTDFRVNERAFQLMEQVSGRAGRKDENGKVLIQVSNTQHPVLQFVRQHNYKEMYDFEISNRRQFFYPPFSRLIHITFRHRFSNVCEEAANIMMKALSAKDFDITGPAEPVVNRIRNQYLWELLIKLPKDAQKINDCKVQIEQQIAILKGDKIYRSVSIIPDVDPV